MKDVCPIRRVCVLGGSLSGLECARHLADAGLEVDIFRRLHDPSRSFLDKHPIYEYCPRALSIPTQDGPFQRWLETWAATGLLIDDASRIGRLCATGSARGVFTATEGVRRVRSAGGGFFGLLDALAARLPDRGTDRPEVVGELSQSDKGWTASDLEGKAIGTFDAVVCSYDYFLRGTRKAAIRALLESQLPATAPLMRVIAGATDSCAFALAASVPGAADLEFDVAFVDGIPELALIVRNSQEGHEARGLPNTESWTLIATPEWTDSIRPNAKTSWDKDFVASRMLRAFEDTVGCSPGRSLRPPYHWGGFASLTHCVTASFAFDEEARLGFVGDFFVGHGANDALRSAASLAAHLSARPHVSVLPGHDSWVARRVSADAEDASALFGKPAATEDHSWPTVAQLASGTLRRGQRCMDRYQRRGVRDYDLSQLRRASGEHPGEGSKGGSARRGRGNRGKGGGYTRAVWRGSSGHGEVESIGRSERQQESKGVDKGAKGKSHGRQSPNQNVRRRWEK